MSNPTIEPSFLLTKTGRQSAVKTAQTTPGFIVKLASASTIVLLKKHPHKLKSGLIYPYGI